jgi:hypothetical protein
MWRLQRQLEVRDARRRLVWPVTVGTSCHGIKHLRSSTCDQILPDQILPFLIDRSQISDRVKQLNCHS